MNHTETRAARYTTLAADVVHDIEIKRSRFICYLRRVESESAARELVAELRKSHYDARHHCSAFVLGPDRDVRRSNDDGEPSGTAGMPMLEALVRRETAAGLTDLSDIVAVVVRYFGGVLLGAGGLVRAYSESVSTALDHATLLTRQRRLLVSVDAGFAQAPRLENELRGQGDAVVLGTDYTPTGARLNLALTDAPGAVEEFSRRIATLTAGASAVAEHGTQWVDLNRTEGTA